VNRLTHGYNVQEIQRVIHQNRHKLKRESLMRTKQVTSGSRIVGVSPASPLPRFQDNQGHLRSRSNLDLSFQLANMPNQSRVSPITKQNYFIKDSSFVVKSKRGDRQVGEASPFKLMQAPSG